MKLNSFRNVTAMALISISFNYTQAAGKPATGEYVRSYSDKMRDTAEQFIKTAKAKKSTAKQIMENEHFDIMANAFGLSAGDRSLLAQAAAKGRTEVITAMYSAIAARELFKADNATYNQFKDVGEGVIEFTKVAAVSGVGATMNSSLKVTTAERAELSQALMKKMSYSIEMLQWSKKEIESHTAIMNKASEIYISKKSTAEEALLLAIMEVKGIDKDSAMKIVRKLKECV